MTEPPHRPLPARRPVDDHLPGSGVHRDRRTEDAGRSGHLAGTLGLGARGLRVHLWSLRDSFGRPGRPHRPAEGPDADRRLVVRVHLLDGHGLQLSRAAWRSACCSAPARRGPSPTCRGVSRWFAPTEQARAQGAVWAASRAGGVLAPWLVVPIMASLGWRAAFWIFGALGLVWAAIWSAWYRDFPAPASSRHDLGDRTAARPGVPWGRLFRAPQLWLLMAMYWCYVWGSMFYLTWLPTYLMNGRGLSEQEVGVYAASPFVLGVAGQPGGRPPERPPGTALRPGPGPSIRRHGQSHDCRLSHPGFRPGARQGRLDRRSCRSASARWTACCRRPGPSVSTSAKSTPAPSPGR